MLAEATAHGTRSSVANLGRIRRWCCETWWTRATIDRVCAAVQWTTWFQGLELFTQCWEASMLAQVRSWTSHSVNVRTAQFLAHLEVIIGHLIHFGLHFHVLLLSQSSRVSFSVQLRFQFIDWQLELCDDLLTLLAQQLLAFQFPIIVRF